MRTRTDDWRKQAACHEHPSLPPETWDGEIVDELVHPQDRAGHQARLRRYLSAKQVCEVECPVRDACLEDARERGDTGVIRGGEPFGISNSEATRIKTRHTFRRGSPAAPTAA